MKRKENNTGSVYKEGDIWRAAIQIGVNENGSPKIKRFRAKTEKEAKQKLRDYRKLISNNGSVSEDGPSVKEYFSYWLKTYKLAELKPASYDRLEQIIENHIYPEIGSLAFSAVTQDVVQRLLTKKKRQGLGYSTLRKIYLAINACYKHNYNLPAAQRLVDCVPSSNINLSANTCAPVKKINPFSIEECSRIIDVCYSLNKNGTRRFPYGAAYVLILNTGLRMGEALALTKSETLSEKEFLYIDKNVITVKNRDIDGNKQSGYTVITQDNTKSFSGQRYIALNSAAKAAIKDLTSLPSNSDFLIVNKKGENVTPHCMEARFKNILKAAGVSQRGVHSLRHTFATRMFEKGANVKTVSQIMGHSSVKLTYDIYIHIINKAKLALSEPLDLDFDVG